MRKTGNSQINVKTYWDGIYADPSKDNDYWGWSPKYKNIRFQTAMEYIKDGDRFLDIGCGHGTFCKGVKEEYPNAEVWGCDIAKETVKRAAKENPHINFIPEEIGNFKSIPENYFDVIFAGEVLEHLTEPKQLFLDAHRLLKKGGIFINTTPLENSIVSPEHMWYFSKDDLEDFYLSTGFKSVKFIDLADMEHLTIIFTVGTK